MIKTYEDYRYHLEADKIALGIKKKKPDVVGDEIWKFQRLMRKTEYYNNCKKSLLWKPYILILKYWYFRNSVKLGFTIPLNVFGPGLSIAHRGTIVVNGAAIVGENCRIHVCVNIGTKAGFDSMSPVIGNNVFIGPGVKIFGNVKIADDIAIGANAVVNKSFEEPGISIAGIPAKKISDNGSGRTVIRATELISEN